MKKAKITEIFSSIQGEGLYAGEMQTFIRFYCCNLGCEFCDEKTKVSFSQYTADGLLKEVIRLKNRTVSLTGGEPLLCAAFLKEFLPRLKKKSFRIYLETNGTLAGALKTILKYIDIISMDMKLPSSTRLRPYWKEHSDFLKAADKKEIFVKAIVTPDTLLSDIEKAASIVRAVDKNMPFIIQPVSYNGSVIKVERLPLFFDRAKESLVNVRIIPQLHRILGVR